MIALSRFVRRIAAAALVLCLSALVPESAAAGPETAIVVHVRSQNGTPVGARVYVIGTATDESYQRLTAGGDARVTVRAGRHWVTVEARGYQTARQQLEVRDGEVREVHVILAELSEIGRTRSRTEVSATVLKPESASRRISGDLADALSSVAGISAFESTSGLGIRVSLDGTDESLSQFTFGGAPLPANAAALAINTDLVQTVQIDQSREMLQFGGLTPTGTPVSRFRLRAGSYGSSFESVSFQNTYGETGVALLHTLRGQESPENGAVYRDSSGASYRHVGALHTTGDYAKITAPVGAFGASAEFASSTNLASPLATYYAGALPAGTGPGEVRKITSSNDVVVLNGALASNSVALTYATFSVLDHDRQPIRLVDGTRFPFDQLERSRVETFSAKVERGFEANLTADASIQVFNQRSTVDVGTTVGDAAQRNAQLQLSVQGPGRSGGNWSATYTAGRVAGAPYGSLEARGTRPLPHKLSLLGVASIGSIAQEPNDVRRARGWIDPYQADFDCTDGAIVTEGPGDPSATPHRFRVFSTLASSGGAVHTSVSAWYTHTSGQLMSAALVPLSSMTASVPTGYLDALIQEAASPLRCGSSGNARYAIFARRDISGQDTTNRGATATAVADRGPLHAELSLEYVSTQLNGLDLRLREPTSIYFTGRQLYGIPPFRATLILDRTLGAKTEALASLHYESANNAFNLPPYLVTAVGIARRLTPSSSISLVAGNIFDTYAGTFVTPRFAIPVQTRNGAMLRGVAAPLAPFRISGQYDLRIGR